jgi:hypothetical protein
MALVIDKDGKETYGGIVAIRNAFVEASEGKLVCLDCTMSYDHSQAPNGQLLKFSGRWVADGSTFEVSKYVPPGGAAASHARAAARELIEGKG